MYGFVVFNGFAEISGCGLRLNIELNLKQNERLFFIEYIYRRQSLWKKKFAWLIDEYSVETDGRVLWAAPDITDYICFVFELYRRLNERIATFKVCITCFA